jgi:hypothetical protein
VHTVGVDPKPTSRPRVQLCTNSHPLRELRGVGEVGKDCRRRGGNQLLDLYRLIL